MPNVGRKKSKLIDVKSLAIVKQMNDELNAKLLTDDEFAVLTMRYAGGTMREIADAFSLSRQQINNILKSGQAKVIAYIKERTAL